ncbi:MAG: NupC/NupG family nucleoside CNT transporter [Gemmataceae bacterium]|nr:NupC/NupG family nucleoside CNT transporter [Gemmataceae bacterium]
MALLGVIGLITLAASCSEDLKSVNTRTLGWGIGLQLLLALFILKLEVFGYRPGYELISLIAGVVTKFLEFSSKGAEFVFGKLADPPHMGKVLGENNGFIFAFNALPTIIFVSSFFTILYFLGVLQWVVRILARLMMGLMRTSGAETLSASANVFMGQTEAPLIIRPYVEKMTRSELLALMVGGMATISGALMAVYIQMKADAVGILATSVMAAPCGLYLAKLLIPEKDVPQTMGLARVPYEKEHGNIVDAAAGGASEGMKLAINVAAMLIAFLALLAMVDACIKLANPALSLKEIFGWVFWPVAYFIGVPAGESTAVGSLLGTKLVANEFVAFLELTGPGNAGLSQHSKVLAAFALTGFANISSIGIQLGGIGAIAPSRRKDLAELGPKALLAGFLATLINAAIAGMLL